MKQADQDRYSANPLDEREVDPFREASGADRVVYREANAKFR